jgi:uncharacterized protein (DUF58 family)
VNAELGPIWEEVAGLLVRWAGLCLVLGAAPLVVLAWRRRIYPNLPLVVLAAMPLAASLAVLVEDRLWPLVLLLDAGIVLAALGDLATLPSPRTVDLKREATRVVSLRKPCRVTLHVSHLGQGTLRVWLRDEVPQEAEAEPEELVLLLAPRSCVSVHYALKARRRGVLRLAAVHLRFRSRLGLWQRYVRLPLAQELHVYPDLKQLEEYDLLARTDRLSLIGVRRTRRIGLENDFERLRDYTLDDNYKHIDWRASARRQKLTVKDFQTSQSQRIVLLLDCGRLMVNESSGLSLLDHALNAALMLGYVALRQGDAVGLIAFADRVLRAVPPRGGMKQMNQLLHACFDRFPELVESRYDEAFLYLHTHVKKRSLVVLLTQVIDEVNAWQIERYLGNLSGRHLPLGVLLRDRALFAAIDQAGRDENSLFTAAAAADILLWRQQVLAGLTRRGALTLDLFPEELTAPLVNTYLEIKARQLL